MRELRYALVTPVRDEEANLPRLASSLSEQTVLPERWMIVDNGSTDGTVALASALAARHSWICVSQIPGQASPARGGQIVRAFLAGVDALDVDPDVIVKLDADVSIEPDYFARLLAAFSAEPRLGIAGGTCWELEQGAWRPQRTTRDHVRGAARAYRRECFADVLPLAERMGWDGIDELKAQTRGWTTRSIADLPIRHHRPLGERERRAAKWLAQGEMAYFMGYRPSYLLARSLYRAIREPTALAMVAGYLRSAMARAPRYRDAAVRKLLRDEQSLRRLPRRVREALGR